MAKWTIKQISDAAEGACFYVTEDKLWLRMDYVMMEENRFGCHNEDNGEEYSVEFEELLDVEYPHFEHLTKTVIKRRPK